MRMAYPGKKRVREHSSCSVCTVDADAVAGVA